MKKLVILVGFVLVLSVFLGCGRTPPQVEPQVEIRLSPDSPAGIVTAGNDITTMKFQLLANAEMSIFFDLIIDTEPGIKHGRYKIISSGTIIQDGWPQRTPFRVVPGNIYKLEVVEPSLNGIGKVRSSIRQISILSIVSADKVTIIKTKGVPLFGKWITLK